MKIISQQDILQYEVGASWWAELIGNSFLQTLAGKYFAWKVNRKYNRYLCMMRRRALIEKVMRGQ